MSEPSDFERGLEAGRTTERLDHHDARFAALNGSLDRIGKALGEITLELQRLRDEALGANSTASAIRDAEEARRAHSRDLWVPFQRTFAVLAAIAILLNLWIAVFR